ncbi:hypothetical protein V502_07785 [Pseudogymnoascus sp. VKM F-4520 (FW-2644)]|nr:hypothetical protein V502_07785 [Pseudogymnoascus sp. VKM F-4520 (FW-2644)]
MPQGCAWGVFDKDGKKDIFGTLNLLTPEVVKSAYAEAKDGISISLNWSLGAISTPGFLRKGLVHKVIALAKTPLACHGFDEEIEFNTQCSSQWDSLVHFNHQPTASGYNGSKPTVDELTQSFGQFDREQTMPTLDHWHSRGGIVGRGVFVDYKRWADLNSIKYSPFEDKRITTKEIEVIAKAQGLEFKEGDIFIIRTGFTEALDGLDAEQQASALNSHTTCGVEGTKEVAKWFWNHHFAAVAGDAIAFEAYPALVDGKAGVVADLVLHQYFLALFGMPIGELWDLKALSDHCAKTGRYTFLLTSSPLNVHGSVGGPPNALALF